MNNAVLSYRLLRYRGGLGNGISFGGLGARRARGSLPKPNLSGCDLTQKIEEKVEVQVGQNANYRHTGWIRYIIVP